MATEQQITAFFNLFKGLGTAHGRFIPTKSEEDTVKKGGRSETVREPTTKSHWANHLDGTLGLGIVPICEDNTCVWGAIDVDVYPLDYLELLSKIKQHNYPLIVCQSKSGGAHLFLFLSEPTNAGIVQKYLRGIAASLGLSGTEIFPKQAKILADRGDVGSWLNMPYFGNTRLAITEHKQLTYDEFISLARYTACKIDSNSTNGNGKLDFSQTRMPDAPPCLQTMEVVGFPAHSRNQTLFGVGVYAKKAFPANWQRQVENYNRTLFTENPLSAAEVGAVVKSLDKKEYFYRCHEEPMVSFCNTQICRTRKYGISTIANMPIINSVTKLTGDSVIWFLDVEGGRLELTTEELFDNKRFQLKCMDALNVLPHRMASVPWTAYLQKLMDTAIIVKTEDVMDYKEQLWDLFLQYCKNRITENPADLEFNRCYYSVNTQELWFKIKDFTLFLQRKQFKLVKTLVLAYLKERGYRRDSRTYNGKLYSFSSVAFNENIEYMQQIVKKESDKEEII